MAARKHREIHDMQQTKEMVPFITCETSVGRHFRELVLVSKKLISEMFLLNICQTTNQAQLCGFLTRVSFVGLRPSRIILITASLSSKTYNIALEPEFFVLDGM